MFEYQHQNMIWSWRPLHKAPPVELRSTHNDHEYVCVCPKALLIHVFSDHFWLWFGVWGPRRWGVYIVKSRCTVWECCIWHNEACVVLVFAEFPPNHRLDRHFVWVVLVNSLDSSLNPNPKHCTEGFCGCQSRVPDERWRCSVEELFTCSSVQRL